MKQYQPRHFGHGPNHTQAGGTLSRHSPNSVAERKCGSYGMLDCPLDTRRGAFGIGTLEACPREVESDQASVA
jgi:hypothetical protein